MQIESRLETEMIGGCVFPIIDSYTGRRTKLCGEPTPILDHNGENRGFCSRHLNMIEEITKERMREKRNSPDGKYPKDRVHHMRIGTLASSIDRKMRVI